MARPEWEAQLNTGHILVGHGRRDDALLREGPGGCLSKAMQILSYLRSASSSVIFLTISAKDSINFMVHCPLSRTAST